MTSAIGFESADGFDRPGSSSPYGQAAKWVWVIGAVQVLLFGCCSSSVALMAMMPLDRLRELASDGQLEQVTAAYPMLGPMAIMVFFLGFVPAVVYLALGFAVNSSRRWAINVALVMTITQGIVFGLVLVNSVVAALTQGSPLALTVNALTVGTLLVLLGYTARRLWLVRSSGDDSPVEPDTDPWNEPRR